MILGFNPRFLDKILSGEKKHTIREDKHNRWRAGKMIHFATGVRTKTYKCFKQDACDGTQTIDIEEMLMVNWYYCASWDNGEGDKKIFAVTVDGRRLNRDEIGMLAENDGFASVQEFFTWFNKNFKGKIIHWTKLRY